MLDLFFIGFIGLLLALGLKRPFFWVLAYIYIDVVAPQKIGWGVIQSLPISLVAFVAAFAGWLFLDSKQGSRFSVRQALILALLGYCAFTTLTAAFPIEALTKWDWVWKALLFAAFLPLTLRTRLRIEAAALVMVLAIGTIIINGGIKTVLGGGGYGELALLVRNNTGLYEGSILSTAAIATIPLALWLARHGTIFKPDWRVYGFVVGLVFACLIIPVGTSARTGLVCAGVLGVLMLRSARYRLVYAGVAALALVAAIPFLPASYVQRMSTLTQTDSDQSASTRMQVWMWTLDYVKEHPLGGGFEAYLGNSFTYETRRTSAMQAEESVHSAEAALKSAELDLEFTEVRTPISGRISNARVTEGNLVTGGSTANTTLLTTVVSLDPLYCYFDADEASALRYRQMHREGKRTSAIFGPIPAEMALGNEQGFPRKGSVDFVDNQINPATGTIRARAVFPNHDQLMAPGFFARVRIPGAGEYDAVLVRDSAIGSDQGRMFVLTVDDKNVAVYRSIKTGPIVDGLRVVREGLKPTDRVIVSGLMTARPGLQVQPQLVSMGTNTIAAAASATKP